MGRMHNCIPFVISAKKETEIQVIYKSSFTINDAFELNVDLDF